MTSGYRPEDPAEEATGESRADGPWRWKNVRPGTELPIQA